MAPSPIQLVHSALHVEDYAAGATQPVKGRFVDLETGLYPASPYNARVVGVSTNEAVDEGDKASAVTLGIAAVNFAENVDAMKPVKVAANGKAEEADTAGDIIRGYTLDDAKSGQDCRVFIFPPYMEAFFSRDGAVLADVIVAAGTGSEASYAHSLGVIPEVVDGFQLPSYESAVLTGITGDGSEQTTAHTLSGTPDTVFSNTQGTTYGTHDATNIKTTHADTAHDVLVEKYNAGGALPGGWEGTHTSSNVLANLTNGQNFILFAFASA